MEQTFEVRPDHLYVACSGKWVPITMSATIQKLREQALAADRTRILVDFREVGPPQEEYYRYLAGMEAAGAFPPPYRIAVIGLKEHINHFAESVARARGADLMVTHEPDEAITWLRGSEKPPVRALG